MKACTKEENRELFERIINGDEAAKKRFIEGNMAYVVTVVKCFLQDAPKHKCLRDDLTSEGYLTLVKMTQDIHHSENPQGFIWTALRNAFIRLVKREKHCERLDKFATYEEDVIKDLRQDIQNCCEDGLDLQIIRLRQQGYTDVKIADICGVSQSCITKRKLSILNKL